MLSDLVRENGRTMIIATHDREMGQIADQVLELREGSLHAMNASMNSAELSKTAKQLTKPNRPKHPSHD